MSGHKPFGVVWDSINCVDGFECDTFEGAKSDALEILSNWVWEERREWKDPMHPTEDEIDNYDHMIAECYVEVRKYNEEKDEYEEYWVPSVEDEHKSGWMYWDEVKREWGL